jgi:AraC-like DNA-binding protein
MGGESMTSTVAAALSGGFIALAALLGLLAWRDARKELAGRLMAGLCLSLAALELTTGPIGGALPELIWTPLRLIGGVNVALLWLSLLAVLRDGFRMRRLEQVGFALFSVGPLVTMFDWISAPDFSLLATLISVAPFLAIGHVMWVAVSERGGDLVAGRQTARIWVVVLLSAAALASVASENLADRDAATLLRLAFASLPGVAVMGVWLTAIEPGRLRFEAPAIAEVAAIPPGVDPRDQTLLAALVSAMDAGLYRESGLTIERVAEVLKTPTHRLRIVINQGLGHRNFASFVNGYRLAYAKAALADPVRGRDTILAIAYESGFASLQTFNRVFKDVEGDTPTGFREKRLREAAQNQKTPRDS